MKMKKRIQITESDRQSILRLHEEYKMSLLSEQASTGTTTGNTTTERWKSATCVGLKKGPKCKDKVLQVQIKINDKCPTDKLPTKLVEDGIMGNKTSSAFTACGGVISGQGQSKTPPAAGAPAAGAPAAGAPAAGAPAAGAPAAGAPAAVGSISVDDIS